MMIHILSFILLKNLFIFKFDKDVVILKIKSNYEDFNIKGHSITNLTKLLSTSTMVQDLATILFILA